MIDEMRMRKTMRHQRCHNTKIEKEKKERLRRHLKFDMHELNVLTSIVRQDRSLSQAGLKDGDASQSSNAQKLLVSLGARQVLGMLDIQGTGSDIALSL